MPKAKSAKSAAVSALDYLNSPADHPPTSICVVYGDEAFLKAEVLTALRREVLAGQDSEFSLTILVGKEAQLRDVVDELSTVSLFGDGRRLVIIEEADSFVSEYRAELEDYVSKVAGTLRVPSASSGTRPVPATSGVLVLDVKAWPGNTRLAKALAATGLAIHCEVPKERELKSWLTKRAKAEHNVKLDAAAADALLELVPPEIGILVQEIAKLSLIAGDSKTIDVNIVRDNVGGWRARAAWDLVDAAADGRAADALLQLSRLIASGEKPHGILPQIASSLRRFATAVDLIEHAEADKRRLPPREALAQAGVLPFKLTDAERQLRQIGRVRAKQLTGWLLAADLAMKSHNSSDDRARIELERIIVRLAATPAKDAAHRQNDHTRVPAARRA